MVKQRQTQWGWRDPRTGRWTRGHKQSMEPVEPTSEIARALHRMVTTGPGAWRNDWYDLGSSVTPDGARVRRVLPRRPEVMTEFLDAT